MPARCFALSHAVELCWMRLPEKVKHQRGCCPRTLAELGSIGRNLNQIARAANQSQLVTSPGRNDLEAMMRVCGTLRDSLKRVLLANLKSWEQGAP